jgi:beta-glucosidase
LPLAAVWQDDLRSSGPFASGQHDLHRPVVLSMAATCQSGFDLANRRGRGARGQIAVIVAEGSKSGGSDSGWCSSRRSRPARRADIVVLAIGESQNMSGEAQSRTEIVVPRAAAATARRERSRRLGKPTVVVLKNGRASRSRARSRTLRRFSSRGSSGPRPATAIADVLFGAYSSVGRLPASFPRAHRGRSLIIMRTSDRATQSARSAGASTRRIIAGIPNSALYPFGHGLTYGRIEYGGLALSSPTLPMTGEDRSRRSDHRTAAAAPPKKWCSSYIHDRAASVTPPDPRAQGLPQGRPCSAGRARRFGSRFAQPTSLLWLDDKPVVEPGTFDVWIAPSAESPGVQGSFELTA